MRAVTLHAFGVTVYGNNNNMKKRNFYKLVKLVLLYLYCYARKKERTDPGAPPWTMDRVDSELAKRLSGNLTMISHVTAHTCQNFIKFLSNKGIGGGRLGPILISMQ